MTIHLFTYPGSTRGHAPDGITCSELPETGMAIADAVNLRARTGVDDILVFWDLTLCDVPWEAVRRFESSLDDVWHPGPGLVGGDEPDLLAFAQPLWIYRPSPQKDVDGAVNWRFDFRAAFIRARVVRDIGGLDGNFETPSGVARELGLRLVRRGGICRQRPELLTANASHEDGPTLTDRYRLLRTQASSKWTTYTLIRRVASRPDSIRTELAAWQKSRSTSTPKRAPIGALQRAVDRVTLPEAPTVSIVLPTFGRYRYLAEVLDDLRAQTIKPTQILIADGNPPNERDLGLYERYQDLPIEVLWHDEPGICSGRNACLSRVTGEFVWFVDDDSRFDAKNLENHLRVLVGYGADVSVGPAYMSSRPELTTDQSEIACGFMDCGTTVCRSAMLAKVGGFDMRFNLYLAGEDNDLGIRFIEAGGLMLNNPLAKRFHYLAPVGGSRSSGSVHRFRRWSLLPRPVQSVYYLARRHFEPGVEWDAMLQASVTVGSRKPNTKSTSMWRVKNTVAEIIAMPLTAMRFIRSARIGRAMLEGGPQIPSLWKRPAETHRGRITPK